MKVVSFFTISAVSAKRDKGKQSKGQLSLESTQGRQFSDCGGITEFTKQMTSLDISSPVDPNNGSKYPPNAFCEWLLQDDCADSFTIKTIKFDIEGNDRCTWDYLALANQDQTFNATYCNDDNDYYDYGSGDSVMGFHALEEGSEIIIPGNSISITFLTDGSEEHDGFQISVIPNRPEGSECSANVREPQCDFQYNNDVKMKTWILSTYDKLVPFSNYADSFELDPLVFGEWPAVECLNRCVATPGCFKINVLGQKCSLRGNKIERTGLGFGNLSFAINGEDCPSDPSNRLWRDRKATTQVFCHFSGVEDAERFLEYLRSNNQQMTKWNVTDVDGHNGALTTRKMTRRWTFSEATERPTTWGHWYTFVTTIFFRDYLVPVNATITSTTNSTVEVPNSRPPNRRRRQADEDKELLAIANQEVQDFIANLEIGDDVEVLETEVSEIELENLDPIDDTDANQMTYAYSNIRNLLDSAMEAKETRRQPQKIKQFDHVNRRFSWMYDHASEDCGTPTDSLFGTDKWTIPEIEEESICSSFVSLMESTMSFYDHKVCLDHINLKENRRARRRYERIESDFFRSKKVFNRLLRGLKCEEQLETD
ncbi:Oidioi.mRNA.OKI2018_I69.chr1.g516.t1.cds [Oikopleura dioica]|uniref:Oidioi.mRNA.OKI2018_I69.chr1.g516.t1.cds n=1 Tax=Oikopleura dioica TaxID=34765 RepID=A0ABN7SNS9_OIKDI|nr:Oidioi.mRNA.OKI2018_I69.chr1.g516.t1.cds [Oikopleura dioica]